MPSLGGWETFYVITGSVGGALTGLMFVVIALASERHKGRKAESKRSVRRQSYTSASCCSSRRC
jgi:hypothetical protein